MQTHYHLTTDINLNLGATPSLLEFARILVGCSDGQADLLKAVMSLQQHNAALRAALEEAGGTVPVSSPVFQGEFSVPNPIVDQTIAAITAATSVEDSALAFIKGVPQMIDAAVAKAIANGATDVELAPLTQLSADLTAKSQAIADAIAANTPVTNAQFKAKKP